MSFVSLGGDYIKDGYTQIDNVFLTGYLPESDPVDVKIYLFGLALAQFGGEDNSVEKLALVLKLSEERVIEGYRRWAEKGLVSMTLTMPVEVKYLSVKRPSAPIIKVEAEKYKPFVEEVNRLFPEKVYSPNEFNAFIELMATTGLESDAMLLIMQYCAEIKGAVSTPYALAVANDWVKKGLLTYEDTDAHIKELENNSEAIRSIFKAMGIKRSADLDDRQLYLKWTREYKYDLNAILAAAKTLKKRGGTERLDALLSELYKAKAYNAAEITEYVANKERLNMLAADTAKALGTYYGSTEVLVESYVTPWLNKGFEKDAVLLMAKFCFLRNIRTFDGLDQLVNKFYSLSLLTAEDINKYVAQQMVEDSAIKEVFALTNYIGAVTNRDRESYRTWIEWGLSDDVLKYVSSLNVNKPFPMQSINRMLSALHNSGVKTVDEAKKVLSGDKKPVAANKDEFMRHEYTDEELKGVLTTFDTED